VYCSTGPKAHLKQMLHGHVQFDYVLWNAKDGISCFLPSSEFLPGSVCRNSTLNDVFRSQDNLYNAFHNAHCSKAALQKNLNANVYYILSPCLHLILKE